MTEKYEHIGCARVKQKPLPLFDEFARKNDPVGSKDRAERLTKTQKLSKQVFKVLKVVNDHAGLTAKDLGLILFIESGIVDEATWPHKNMMKLVSTGLVERIQSNIGFRCYITEWGIEALKNLE